MVYTVDFQLERDVPELTGKVLLITGGTRGLGAGSVALLAKRNPAKIYITGRDKEAAQTVVEQAQAEGSKTEIIFLPCDQSSLASVKQVADTILANETRLDVLMANAGIMATPPGLSKDGYEIQFGVNHMAHALLIQKLLPLMEATAATHGDVRLIVLSSFAFIVSPPFRGIVFEDLKTTQDYWVLGDMQRYGQSKLATMLYGREMARRYPNITTVVLHPGEIQTSLFEHVPSVTKLFIHMATYFRSFPYSIGNYLPVEQGPYNQVWAVGAPKESIESGELYEPVGVRTLEYPSFRLDDTLAGMLWNWTEGELKRWVD